MKLNIYTAITVTKIKMLMVPNIYPLCRGRNTAQIYAQNCVMCLCCGRNTKKFSGPQCPCLYNRAHKAHCTTVFLTFSRLL